MKLRVTLDGESAEVTVEKVEAPPVPKDIALVITAAVSAVLEGRPFQIRQINHASRPTGPWAHAARL